MPFVVNHRSAFRSLTSVMGVMSFLALGCSASADTGSDEGTSTAASTAAIPAGHMRFDLERAVVNTGTCPLDIENVRQQTDASALELGSDDFTFELPLTSGDLVDLTICSLRVPFEVADGYYIDGINLKADYFAFKTANTVLSFSANVSVSQQPAAAAKKAYGRGVLATADNLEASADFGPKTCGRNSNRGILSLNLGIGGRRPEGLEGAYVTLSSLKLRDGQEISVKRCP